MSILKELIQNISHCLPTDCPIDGVSIFYCNIFLVPAERLYMVPSLPHCVTHNRCQTTELANECCLPATQLSPDNTRLALPQGVLLPCSAEMLWGWHITYSLSPEIIAQAVSLYQENRRGWEAKKHDIKIQMPSSVA